MGRGCRKHAVARIPKFSLTPKNGGNQDRDLDKPARSKAIPIKSLPVGWITFLGVTRRRAAHGNAIIKTHGCVERERPMLRKTVIVLASAAALCGGLTDDALALATGHSGWDGLGDGVGHPILSQKTPKRYVAPTKPRIRKSFSVGRVRSKFLPAKESLRMWPRAVWHPQTP